MKPYWHYNKNLKAKQIMDILKKLTKFHQVVIMIKDYRRLRELHYILTVQMLKKYAK